ncbi:ABC transporter G family member 40 [Citrus sinensis]|uniref:ABC transporter G family member 40 n=1 Tax=Citrus sinensis TaxID=2711 RepID=A0ACB8IZW0_CITSI|nr:ABC transporter G family member 40 [Citrus sinensis]
MTEAAIEANNHNKRGMVLLFEPHYISLNEIVYSVDMPQARVLSSYRSDGVSGAGKTTLMDVLAGRKPGGYITRNITVSGYPEKQETFARILGDEPISGLDARAATTVIRMVRNTVDMGRTVVCTIHQPSIDIFYSFDEESQSGNNRIKQACSSFKVPPFFYSVLSIDLHEIVCLVMETGSTTLVILATKQQHLFNVMVSMYTAVLFLLVQNAGSLQLVAAVEWTIFYRESALGTYSAMPYALRK